MNAKKPEDAKVTEVVEEKVVEEEVTYNLDNGLYYRGDKPIVGPVNPPVVEEVVDEDPDKFDLGE